MRNDTFGATASASTFTPAIQPIGMDASYKLNRVVGQALGHSDPVHSSSQAGQHASGPWAAVDPLRIGRELVRKQSATINPMLQGLASLLDPLAARLSALHTGVMAATQSVAEFFRLLPSVLASGAADTMAAHGRDPNGGLELALNFEATDPDDWDDAARQQWEWHSYFQAVNGFYPSELQHMGLYALAQQRQHHFYR